MGSSVGKSLADRWFSYLISYKSSFIIKKEVITSSSRLGRSALEEPNVALGITKAKGVEDNCTTCFMEENTTIPPLNSVDHVYRA